jgi:hypothetical protein
MIAWQRLKKFSSRSPFFGRPGTLSPLLLAHFAPLHGLWGTGLIVGAAIVTENSFRLKVAL